MDSHEETHQKTISSIESRLRSQFKTYRFFVFLDRNKHQSANNLCSLQKINFKLNQERNSHGTHEKYSDNKKQILMSFHDLSDDTQVQQALIQLKNQALQHKTRIIVYSKESTLIRLIKYARSLDVKTQNIPIALYSSGINNDLSAFLGWEHSKMKETFNKSLNQFEPQCKKWIHSPSEKIDSWSVRITVDQNVGQIYRFDKVRNQQYRQELKQVKDEFLSSISIGTHPQLFMDFQHKRQYQSGFFDKFLYKIQGLKKFCCVGSPNMRAATGVINAQFTDDLGEDHQIFRQFHQNSEPSSVALNQHKNIKNAPHRVRKRILSILVSNIDRFHGNKLEKNQGFRINDNKLELFTFQSMSDYTKLASIRGDIKFSLQSQKSVFVQVNDTCYRLQNPKSIIIKKAERYKVLINKETLQC